MSGFHFYFYFPMAPIPTKTYGTTHQHIKSRFPVLIISATLQHDKSYKKSLRSTLMRISRIWTSITSLETRQQPRYPLKNDWSHPLYHPLYQKFIPTHHLAPKKNNSETKSLTLSKSTNLTPAASQLSTTTFRTSTVDLFCGNR